MDPAAMRPRSLRVRGITVHAVVVAAAVLLFSGLAATRAEAHATLQETSPTDGEVVDVVPDVVSLRFDEPVQVLGGGLEVYDPAGRRVDEGQESADGGRLVSTRLGDGGVGTYTVAWRAVSEDSHNLEGSFVFHVGEETGRVSTNKDDDTSASVARWLGSFAGLAGLLVALGGALVAWSAPRPARSAVRTLVTMACVVSAAGWFVALAGYSAALTGRSLDHLPAQSVVDIVTDTRAGQLLALRCGLMAAAGLVLVVGARIRSRSLLLAPLFLAAGAMVATSAAGHAWTASPRALAVLVDLSHLLAAGIWVGGLAALLVVIRQTDDAAPVRSFSSVALWVAGLAAATGSTSAYLELPSLDALWSTTYGRLVLAKAAGFGVLVAFGWHNRRILGSWAEDGVRRLASSLVGEVVVALVVVAITATLVGTPPPKEPGESGPIIVTAQADGASVDGILEPGTVGVNNLHLFFFGADGAPLVADAVEVTVESPSIPPRRLEVTPVTPDHVSVLALSIPTPDTWTFTVTAVSAGNPYVFEFETEIS